MENNLLFTFLIPAYNGSEYIENSIHSLINSQILKTNIFNYYEIIIINDGSKDNTFQKSKKIANQWNKIVREDFIKVIDKENGQYGSVINRGIQEANGLYFKVLDVDDTFNVNSLIKLIKITKGLNKKVDVLFTDFTFEKIAINYREVQSLRKWFTPYKIQSIKKQKFPSDLITMHSIIYRTQLLKDIKYKQIENVYYSDSQYSLIPLEYAKSFYYIQIPLYRYYIGRNEQSINLRVMVKNREHQLQVLKIIWKNIKFKNKNSLNLNKYLMVVMKQMLQWQVMLISFDKNIKNKKKYIMNLLKELKNYQPIKYYQITNNILFHILRITRCVGMSFIIRQGTKIYSKFKKNILSEWG